MRRTVTCAGDARTHRSRSSSVLRAAPRCERGTIYALGASYEVPDYDDVRAPSEQRSVIQVGDVVEIGDLTIHVRSMSDPDAIEPVSYVVEHDNGKLTCLFPSH